MNILFVCTGNTCRSPMAEHLFRKMLAGSGRPDILVASAGIHPAVHLELPQEARSALRAEGVEGVHHRPRGIDEALVGKADFIFVMEDRHREAIARLFPQHARKIHLLKEFAGVGRQGEGIADPYGQSAEAYAGTLREIKRCLEKIISRIGQ